MKRIPLNLLCLACLAAGAGLQWVDAADAEILAKFNKEYNNPTAAGRKAALDPLRGSSDQAIWQRLAAVATTDPDTTVQTAAFDALCTGVDPDGRLAAMACQIFLAAKNRDAKLALVDSLEKLEFKVAPLQTLIKFMEGLVYPILLDPNDFKDQSKYQAEEAKTQKARTEFEKCMSAINSLAGKDFSGTTRTKNEIKTWWRTGEAEVTARDQKLREEKKKAAAPPKK